MKYLLIMALLWTSVSFAETCKSKLDSLQGKVASKTSIDPRISLQVMAAANRIANESLWNQGPEVMKISETEFKSTFIHQKTNLVVFYNKQAEIFGYIKNKNSYWCMKDK